MSEPLALQLADWAIHFPSSRIPQAQARLAWIRLQDTTGLILGGFETPAADAVLAIAREQGGGTGATLIGSTAPVAASWAALVHGTIAHCRDFDDTFPESVVHAGSTIVATALAVGEAVGAGQDDILAAIVVGYELAARLGAAGGRALHAKGFHASGIYGPLLASAVAGRLYGLSRRGLAQAMGLAGSMAGGLLEFQTDGSWSKWLHIGWSGFGGILAARLAGRGFPGPVSVLDGDKGFFRAFLDRDRASLQPILEGLGSEWLGDGALPKYFPCAAINQPYIAAVLRHRDDWGGPDRIEAIECAVPPWAVPIVCEPLDRKRRPQTELDVIAGLPFVVAAALRDGRVDLDTLAPAYFTQEPLRELSARVGYRPDPELGQSFDGIIDVNFRDGSSLRVAAPTPLWDEGALGRKFRALAGRALPPEQVGLLAQAFDGRSAETIRLIRNALSTAAKRAPGPG